MIHTKFFEGSRAYHNLSLRDITGPRAAAPDTRTRYAQPKKIFVRVEHSRLDKSTFDRLTADWVEAISHCSSLDQIVSDKNYLKIISYGRDALPFIFADLRSSPKPWFFALRQITGANPIPADSAGNFQVMIASWLKWAESNNL